MAEEGIAVEVGLLSCGYGPLQRRVCEVLLEYEGLAVETTDLKKLISPEGDRSNLRRAFTTAVRLVPGTVPRTARLSLKRVTP